MEFEIIPAKEMLEISTKNNNIMQRRLCNSILKKIKASAEAGLSHCVIYEMEENYSGTFMQKFFTELERNGYNVCLNASDYPHPDFISIDWN